MALENNAATWRGKCDGCGLLTPGMRVTDNDVAAQVLRAAGWKVAGSLSFCPRCKAKRAAAA